MIDNWFKPLSEKDTPGFAALKPYSFGRQASLHRDKVPDLTDTRVALIGIGDRECRALRKQLYQLSFPFGKHGVADLGNARRKNPSFLIPAIKELLESDILPVVFGQDPGSTLAQAKAFLGLKSHLSLVLADEKPPLSPDGKTNADNYLDPLLHGQLGHLFHLGLLGIQGHFTDPSVFRYVEEQNFDMIRLGQARDEMETLEPIVRDADLFSFNLSCIKEVEAPEVKDPSPSGFTTEEACRLCRYAGMSDKLRSFGLFGYTPQGRGDGRTARVSAQLVWYFLDGFFSRKNDFPASMDGLVEYIVDVPSAGHQIVFWKSKKSGRWWMQVPVRVKDGQERHRLVPCTLQDYQTACQDDLPMRLMQAFNRFG